MGRGLITALAVYVEWKVKKYDNYNKIWEVTNLLCPKHGCRTLMVL